MDLSVKPGYFETLIKECCLPDIGWCAVRDDSIKVFDGLIVDGFPSVVASKLTFGQETLLEEEKVFAKTKEYIHLRYSKLKSLLFYV